MPYKCSCNFTTEKGNSFSAHFRHHAGEQHQRLGWVDPTTGEVSPTKPTPKRKPPGQPKTPSEKEGGGPLATIVAKQPAPVVFTIGQQKIDLDPEKLYQGYILYEDVKAKCGLTDSYSDVILDAMGLVWRVLASEPVIVDNKVTVEVCNE